MVRTEIKFPFRNIGECFLQIKENKAKINLLLGDKLFNGTIDFVAPVIDTNTDTLLVRAKIENPNNELPSAIWDLNFNEHNGITIVKITVKHKTLAALEQIIKMGFKEGDVIQHSWVSSSVERAQKKVEENHFGTRKRLLEYDDVMNAQREVIYKRRQHALIGERITFDLINMFYDLSFEICNDGKLNQNIETFKLDCIRFLTVDTDISEEDLKTKRIEDLTEQLYHEVYQKYLRKSDEIVEKAYPIVKNVFEQKGNQYINIILPFSDGTRNVNIVANLEKSYHNKGRELTKVFEQNIILLFIDHHWKDHLRQMDELKHSVQMAVHEQKDPLLIFKFEAFELFKQMLSSINKDVSTFLLKGHLPIEDAEEVQQHRQTKRVVEKTTESRGDGTIEDEYNGAENGETREKQQPVRAEVKVGRNDLCPCGSGKKFKHCHGKEMA